MSLTWDMTKVEDAESLLDGDVQERISKALVWVCVGVDMGEITSGNWSEFYARMEVWNTLHGYETEITAHDVRRRIGLRTNVVTRSRQGWLNRVGGHALDRVRAEAEDEVQSVRV